MSGAHVLRRRSRRRRGIRTLCWRLPCATPCVARFLQLPTRLLTMRAIPRLA